MRLFLTQVQQVLYAEMWNDCYEETLSDEDQLKVTKEPGSTNSSLVMVENLHLLKKLSYQQ